MASDLIYPDKVGETYRFAYNPLHRWFYYPNLERDEAILLKCYDSGRMAAPALLRIHLSMTPPVARMLRRAKASR